MMSDENEYSNHSKIPENETVDNILIKFSDGRVFSLDAEIIASDFASYYSESKDRDYEEEFNFAINDPYQLYDWLCGNMNWVDIKDDVELVRREDVDPKEAFPSDIDVNYKC